MLKKTSQKADSGAGTKLRRTTMFFDKALLANLSYWSRKTGMTQAEIVRKALRKYLEEECKLEPDRIPTVDIRVKY